MQNEIEQMAKDIEQARIKAADTTNSMNYGFGGWYAKELYTAGYRKASDVAREIFGEIEKVFGIDLWLGSTPWKYADYERLKKKYTEEGK